MGVGKDVRNVFGFLRLSRANRLWVGKMQAFVMCSLSSSSQYLCFLCADECFCPYSPDSWLVGQVLVQSIAGPELQGLREMSQEFRHQTFAVLPKYPGSWATGGKSCLSRQSMLRVQPNMSKSMPLPGRRPIVRQAAIGWIVVPNRCFRHHILSCPEKTGRYTPDP